MIIHRLSGGDGDRDSGWGRGIVWQSASTLPPRLPNYINIPGENAAIEVACSRCGIRLYIRVSKIYSKNILCGQCKGDAFYVDKALGGDYQVARRRIMW